MATFTDRLELLITATSKGAVKEIQSTAAATEELTAAQKVMGAGQGLVNSQLQKFGITAGEAGTALKVAGVAAGAFAAVEVGKWAFDAAKAFADVTGQVRAFQRVAGTSAEDSSRLVAVTKELGINTTSAETGFFQLGKRIALGKDTLDQYGASVIRSKDGNVDMAATLESAATAYQKITDPAARDAFIFQNFGKTGRDLIPLLQQSTSELQHFFDAAAAHHEVFSQADLERGRQFSLAMRELSQTFEGLKISAGQAVAPVFTSIAQSLSNTITSVDQATQSFGGLGGVLKTGWEFTPLAGGLHEVSAAADLAQGHFGDAASEFVRGIPVVGGLASAFGLGADDTNKYADAQSNLKDKTSEMLQLQAEGKTHTKEYADAQASAAGSAKTLAEAQKGVTDALQSTAQAQLASTVAGLNYAQANLAQQSAVTGYKQALDDATKADLAALDAQQHGIDQSSQVEAAHQKVEAAILGVVKAASDRAVQALGPGASADAQAKASTDAISASLNYLAQNATPETIQALKDLGYTVVTLPTGATIVIKDNAAEAASHVESLTQAMRDYLSVTGGDPSRYYSNPPPGPPPRSVTAGATAGTELVAAPMGLDSPSTYAAGATGGPTFAPMTMPATFASAPTFNISVNVATTGLGADAPEIQRQVVAAIRGYVQRNGPVVDIVQSTN
jgi:hypothetical protein